MASSPPSPSMKSQSAYTCDTLPVPQNLRSHRQSRSPSPVPSPPLVETILVPSFDVLSNDEVHSDEPLTEPAFPVNDGAPTPQPPARKLCVRHRRMADGETNLRLQKSLDALPFNEREAVNKIWSGFSSSSHTTRAVILRGILTTCCFSQLSMLSDELKDINRVDPFQTLPRESALKVLGYLDAISLCRAAQVNRHWKKLADDDILWRSICEQHIGQKCHKCGWGLPILERRRKVRPPSSPPSDATLSSSKRCMEEDQAVQSRPLKRQKSSTSDGLAAASLGALSIQPSQSTSETDPSTRDTTSLGCIASPHSESPPRTITRPWKDVYSERLTIERNWRRGRCTVRTLKGHTDGVMCLQYSETLQHPTFPILITGSYDRTVRVWNMESGTEIACLRGHSRAIRALQFDEAKLITGSLDHTIRVWNWRTGRCIRTLDGHTDGVVCLNYDANVLASGSADRTVKIWNFRTGECFTLRGHHDWVNSVQLWDTSHSTESSSNCSMSFDESPTSSEGVRLSNIDPGKMLFSASDDGSIRLWDLTARSCVRDYRGHVGQVQSMKLLLIDPSCEERDTTVSDGVRRAKSPPSNLPSGLPGFAPASISVPSPPPVDHPGYDSPAFTPPVGFDPYAYRLNLNISVPPQAFVHSDSSATAVEDPHHSSSTAGMPSKSGPKPVLVSGSLDNTICIWDVDTGKKLQTLFGHIEGVWAVAGDKLRLVSGSHDRTIKVWVREEGKCMATLVGHRAAVTCLSLGDDKIVSGSDDGDIRVWSFAE